MYGNISSYGIMKFFDRKNKIDCLIYLKVCWRLRNTYETTSSSWKKQDEGKKKEYNENEIYACKRTEKERRENTV